MELTQEEKLRRLKAELAKRELARRHFNDYLAYAHNDWIRTRMSEYLAKEVQGFIETATGNAYDILVIETPPQHGKSRTITESLPAWVLGRHPDWRVIIGSYNDESAERFCRRNKEKVSQFGKTLFGMGIGSISRATEFELENKVGRIISRGIMSGVTGNPANFLLIDDPIKNRQEADSEASRGKLWDEWQNSFKSRLAAGAKVIVIATPWHEDDMLARLLATETNIRLIRLPIEAEENDPLGRAPGEPLCPELGKDANWLAQFKSSYLASAEGGHRAWTALYQCSPQVEGGNLIHRDWWRFYDPAQSPAFGTELISVDAAFKDGEDNDYVSIQVWGKAGAYYYLEYCLNKHLDFVGTLAAIRQLKTLYPYAQHVLIEDKANGSAIINVLQREMFCIPVNPKGGKVARVNAISAAIESGHVFLPQAAPWLGEFLDQFSAFPAGAHDDMCFAAGTMVATLFGDKPIEQISEGEYVLTPFGLRRVLWSGQTGVSEVITRVGLTGTAKHPVFSCEDNSYHKLETLTDTVHCDKLYLKGVVLWKYRKLLSSTELNTDSWAPEDTILVSPNPMKAEGMLKDFMLRCGSFIRAKQFRKGMKFIIRTATLLITTTATWSAYREACIVQCIRQRIKSGLTSMKSGLLRLSGTRARKAENGIESTLRPHLASEKLKSTSASFAERHSKQNTQAKRAFAVTTARLSGIIRTIGQSARAFVSGAEKSFKRPFHHARKLRGLVPVLAGQSCEQKNRASEPTTVRPLSVSARYAGKSSSLCEPMGTQKAKNAAQPIAHISTAHGSAGVKVPVYNLTVDRAHVFYANGILVHNCDAASQALNYMLYSTGVNWRDDKPDRQDRLERFEQERFLDGSIYDVYTATDAAALPPAIVGF